MDVKLPLKIAAMTALGLWMASPVRAETVYVPAAQALGRWTWTPAENATAYNVRASINGGAYSVVRAVTVPEVTLPFALGQTVEIVVEPLAPGTNAAPGPLSDASAPARFLGSPDLDGDGVVRNIDANKAAVMVGRCIRQRSSGVAVASEPCAQ